MYTGVYVHFLRDTVQIEMLFKLTARQTIQRCEIQESLGAAIFSCNKCQYTDKGATMFSGSISIATCDS